MHEHMVIKEIMSIHEFDNNYLMCKVVLNNIKEDTDIEVYI